MPETDKLADRRRDPRITRALVQLGVAPHIVARWCRRRRPEFAEERDRAVLRLLHRHGPRTVRQLALELGLNRSTAANAVRRLYVQGRVESMGPAPGMVTGQRRGRHAALWRLREPDGPPKLR